MMLTGFPKDSRNFGLANSQRVYIDKTGKIVSNPDYQYTHAWFSEGLAPAKKGDKWGYVSKEWKFVIEPKFDNVAHAFSVGLAHVRVNGKYGFIDVTGRMVIPPSLDSPALYQCLFIRRVAKCSGECLAGIDSRIRPKPSVVAHYGWWRHDNLRV